MNQVRSEEKVSNTAFGRLLLIGILIGAVLTNIAQFADIESQNTGGGGRYQAINREATSSIIDIGVKHSPHFREAYGLALALAEIAPGAKLLTPSKGTYSGDEFRTRMIGFGRVASIEQLSYDPETFLADFDPSDFIVASGEGGNHGNPFAIAVGKHPPEEFIVLRRDGPLDLLIDKSLFSEGALKEVIP